MSKDVKKSVVSGLFWTYGERITAQLVTTVVGLVLANILSPSHFGLIAKVEIFITIANVFVSHGFGNALIQKKDADELDFSSVFFASTALSILLYFALFFSSGLIAKGFKSPELSLVLRVLGLRVIVAAYNSVQHAYISRHMDFKRFFFSTLFGTVISAVVGITMALMGAGVWAIVAQYLTNTTIDTMVLHFTCGWRPKLLFSMKRVLSLLSYGWKILVSGLIDTLYNDLRSFVIGIKYTDADLAFYTQGKKFPNLIVTNINTSISKVLFPAMSNVNDERERVKQMTRRSIKVSSFVMCPLLVGLAVCAKPLILILLNEEWLPCVPFLQIWAFIFLFYPIHTANLQAINAIGRSDIFLTLEIIKKVIGIGLLFASVFFFDSVLIIAMSGMVTTILSCFINAFPNRKLLNYSYVEQAADLLPALLLGGGMGAAVYAVQFLGFGAVLTLAIQVPLGVVIYVLGAKIFKFDSYTYIISIIKSFLHKRKKAEKEAVK